MYLSDSRDGKRETLPTGESLVVCVGISCTSDSQGLFQVAYLPYVLRSSPSIFLGLRSLLGQ